LLPQLSPPVKWTAPSFIDDPRSDRLTRANGDGASEPTATGRRSAHNAIAERAGLNKLAMHRRKVVPVDPARSAAL
jgi:hypothetical protein